MVWGSGRLCERRLAHMGMLKAIAEQVRFSRARFGKYDLRFCGGADRLYARGANQRWERFTNGWLSFS